MAITKSDVLKAIDALEANQQNPTNDNLLAHLGSGSKTTINKYRKEILEERIRAGVKQAATLKEDELTAVSTLVAKLLTDRVTQLDETQRQAISNLEQQLALTTADLEKAQDQVLSLQRLVESAQDQAKIAQATLANYKDEAKAEYVALQVKYEQLLQQSGKVEYLEEKLAAAVAQVELFKSNLTIQAEEKG